MALGISTKRYHQKKTDKSYTIINEYLVSIFILNNEIVIALYCQQFPKVHLREGHQMS